MSRSDNNGKAIGGLFVAAALIIYSAIAQFSAWLGVDIETGAAVCERLAICSAFALVFNVLVPGLLTLRHWPIYLASIWVSFWPALTAKGSVADVDGFTHQVWWGTSLGQWAGLVFIVISGYALINAISNAQAER